MCLLITIIWSSCLPRTVSWSRQRALRDDVQFQVWERNVWRTRKVCMLKYPTLIRRLLVVSPTPRTTSQPWLTASWACSLLWFIGLLPVFSFSNFPLCIFFRGCRGECSSTWCRSLAVLSLDLYWYKNSRNRYIIKPVFSEVFGNIAIKYLYARYSWGRRYACGLLSKRS